MIVIQHAWYSACLKHAGIKRILRKLRRTEQEGPINDVILAASYKN